MQGVLESFLGTAIAGGVFCLLAGQPLTILSSTGPVLVFERLLFNFSKCVLHFLSLLKAELWLVKVRNSNPSLTAILNPTVICQLRQHVSFQSFSGLSSLIFWQKHSDKHQRELNICHVVLILFCFFLHTETMSSTTWSSACGSACGRRSSAWRLWPLTQASWFSTSPGSQRKVSPV